MPYIESHFTNKPATVYHYKFGVKRLLAFPALADARLDAITPQHITQYVELRRGQDLEVSSINRQLSVLRRMFKLAMEWGKTDRTLPRVSMLPGEKRRERVLTGDEETVYFSAANSIGDSLLESYNRALNGIRAIQRGEEPIKPTDPYLLRDLATILIECALRPENMLPAPLGTDPRRFVACLPREDRERTSCDSPSSTRRSRAGDASGHGRFRLGVPCSYP